MMPAYFLLKVIVCSSLLLAYYWLALRNKAFHQWNRFYLLAAVVLSMLLPLLPFSWVVEKESTPKLIQFISVAAVDESVVSIAKQKPLFSLSAEQALLMAYAAIGIVLLLGILKAAKGILNILKGHSKQKVEGVYFLNTEAKGTPFSFFNYLVWNRHIDVQAPAGQLIFRHELVHIRQKHTLDKVFLLIVLIPFWANPFFWIIRRELSDIHEFIADEKALEGGSTEDLSKMMLNALYPQHVHLLYSAFFQSSIRRRLHMFAIKNQKINYMSRILVLPLLLIIAAAFTIRQEAQKENEAFSNKQAFHFLSDTIPTKESNIIVEEFVKTASGKEINNAKRSATEISDTVPKNGARGGFLADTKNKIILEADEIINHAPQDESYTGPQTALLIVNGKKMDNTIWRDKTIISKRLTIYPKADKSAIELYGTEASKGVMVFEGAKIINKMESELYREFEKDTIPQDRKKEDEPVFSKVEVEPKFDGDWVAFLRKNLDPALPLNNGAPAGQYTVIAEFIVNIDGTISSLKALTKHGYGMEEEVLKLIELSPKWQPALQNGRKVRAYKKQPITFVISKE